MITDRQLAEAALEAGLISLEQLKSLVPAARKAGRPLAAALADAGLDEAQVTFLQACVLGLPFALPHRVRVARRARLGMPWDLQRRYFAVPLRLSAGRLGERLYVAALPEAASELANALTPLLNLTVLPVAAPRASIAASMSAPSTDAHLPDAEAIDLDTPADPAAFAPRPARPAPARPPIAPVVTSLADF